MRRTLSSILIVGGLALTTAACAVEPAVARPAIPVQAVATDGVQRVAVKVGNSMSFDPAQIVVKAGQPVELTLQNTGFLPHDLTLSNGTKLDVSGGTKTARATFTLDKPGTYPFVCSVQGHEQAGMKGTIVAE